MIHNLDSLGGPAGTIALDQLVIEHLEGSINSPACLLVKRGCMPDKQAKGSLFRCRGSEDGLLVPNLIHARPSVWLSRGVVSSSAPS